MSSQNPNGGYYLTKMLANDVYTPYNQTIQNGVNPQAYYNPQKFRMLELWQNYDLNQCCSRYVWEGLPQGLTSWQLERMLYLRGSLACFEFAGKLYILPYYIEGNLNPYGLPVKIKPQTFAGESNKLIDFAKDFTLPVDNEGDLTDDYSAVLLHDSIPYAFSSNAPSRAYLNNIILQQIVDVFARVNINVVVSNKKICIIAKDPKQADIIKAELEQQFNSDCPFIVLSSPYETDTIQSSSDFAIDEMFSCIQNYDSIRCFMNGIASKGFGVNKKERMVTGELAGAEEETNLVLDMGLDLRENFAEYVTKKFSHLLPNGKLTCHTRSSTYENDFATEENGKGETAEEEIDE